MDRGEINAYRKYSGNIVGKKPRKQKILNYQHLYEQNQINFILPISVVE